LIQGALVDHAHLLDQVEHSLVRGEHGRPEPAQASASTMLEERREQDRPEPPALPAVLYYKRDLGFFRPWRAGLAAVPRDADQLVVGTNRDDRGAAVVIHGGEDLRPVRWQSPHHREEALIRALRRQPVVEDGQGARVIGPNRAKPRRRAVA
jgi:hypothetical protein